MGLGAGGILELGGVPALRADLEVDGTAGDIASEEAEKTRELKEFLVVRPVEAGIAEVVVAFLVEVASGISGDSSRTLRFFVEDSLAFFVVGGGVGSRLGSEAGVVFGKNGLCFFINFCAAVKAISPLPFSFVGLISRIFVT